jgi:hypothetical protein
VVKIAVKRTISKSKYLIAAIITFMIFSLGLTLGIIVDNFRIAWADFEIRKHELEYSSLQFQYLYISTLEKGEESCEVLNTALEKTIAQLGESLDQFLEYEKRSNLNKRDYEIIKRKYLLDNIRYWLLAKRAKELCNLDKVTILYFHSIKDCDICPEQGVVLTYYKKIFGERLLVFPINIDLETEESMITILRSRYNITTYPSIIVEDNLYEGVVGKKKLKKLICSSFKDEQPECIQNA